MVITFYGPFFSESMRIYPPAPVYLRKCTEDYTIPGTNTVIEKGTSVLIPAIALHRDPDYFPNPEHFNPERFNETNKKLIKDYTYIPFGEGPRVCIGEQIIHNFISKTYSLHTSRFKICNGSSKTSSRIDIEAFSFSIK